ALRWCRDCIEIWALRQTRGGPCAAGSDHSAHCAFLCALHWRTHHPATELVVIRQRTRQDFRGIERAGKNGLRRGCTATCERSRSQDSQRARAIVSEVSRSQLESADRPDRRTTGRSPELPRTTLRCVSQCAAPGPGVPRIFQRSRSYVYIRTRACAVARARAGLDNGFPDFPRSFANFGERCGTEGVR